MPALIRDAPLIVGATAIPALEGWIPALIGVSGTERMPRQRAEAECERWQIQRKSTAAMVAIVDRADLAHVPKDATCLRLWLNRAQAALKFKTAEFEEE